MAHSFLGLIFGNKDFREGVETVTILAEAVDRQQQAAVAFESTVNTLLRRNEKACQQGERRNVVEVGPQ